MNPNNATTNPQSSRLLALSDELLSMICGYAMTYQPPSPSSSSSLYTPYPAGVIAEQLTQTYRLLLHPFRSHPRLYNLARHNFLLTNTVALSLLDLRNSAIRIEQQPRHSQMLCTGNPDPLLAALVHLQVGVSVSDFRAPLNQNFMGDEGLLANAQDAVAAGAMAGAMWRARVNMRNFRDERDALKGLGGMCVSLQSVHLFLKVDERFLFDSAGRDLGAVKLERGERKRVEQGMDAATRYRVLAQELIALMAEVPVKMGTVAFHHWRADVGVLDWRDWSPVEVLDGLLEGGKTKALNGRIARVRTAGTQVERRTSVAPVKTCWGASDDIKR